MSSAMARGLSVLELLAGKPAGLPLHVVSDHLEISRSAGHRVLTHLVEEGYLRQEPNSGFYVLTLKLVSLALRHLAEQGIVEQVRPSLLALAKESGELARLSLVDNRKLVWVAKEQGATSGLRFDPDSGQEVTLSSSASGLAWLSRLSENEALELVYAQGFPTGGHTGPKAPSDVQDFLARLHTTREQGYAVTADTFEAGTAAVAVPIVHRRGHVVGVLSIAGPSIRLTEARMHELASALLVHAAELAELDLDSAQLAHAI
ncbi:MAG: IclR family transcriptional regulator [Rhodococcus sp. (in: high G+C Gram-positive bacteria)]|nr:MAG: IclR family transcriptional regulator [Rhodococcus sp. (in: high G+C Gram-positive bacteria)]